MSAADQTLYAHWANCDQTLYAHWTKLHYRVRFDPQGGVCIPLTRQVAKGEAYGALPTPTHPIYTTFLGWFTAASGGTQVTAASIVPEADTTLYAHWSGGAETVTITLHPNGEPMDPSTISRTIGGTYGILPTPTRPGCTFAGWVTAAYGETVLQSGFVVFDDGDLYALWTYGTPTRRRLGARSGGGTVAASEFVPVINPSPCPPGVGSLMYDPATGKLIYHDQTVSPH